LDFSQSPAPTAVACNSEGIVVLFEDGTIAVADANGVRIPEFKSPVSSEKEEDSIVQIACNNTHAYIRTKCGKLYQYVTHHTNHSNVNLHYSRWNKKQPPTEVALPNNADAVWLGGSSAAHNHMLVLAETEQIPDNFWESCRVCLDHAGTTLGFLLKEGERVVLRTFDMRTGNHLSDSEFSSEPASPSGFCSLHDNLTWVTVSGNEIWAKRAQVKGMVLPPEPLSPLSYLFILFFSPPPFFPSHYSLMERIFVSALLPSAGKRVDVHDGIVSLLAGLDACLWNKDRSLFIDPVSFFFFFVGGSN
jgi:hypothetical protein